MKAALACFAVTAFAALVAVSVWATGHISIVPAMKALTADPAAGSNPWFVATIFDAYFGFLWFWLWVAYKERTWLSRIVWLAVILTAGNMAMAGYVLIQLWRLPSGARMETLLLRN